MYVPAGQRRMQPGSASAMIDIALGPPSAQLTPPSSGSTATSTSAPDVPRRLPHDSGSAPLPSGSPRTISPWNAPIDENAWWMACAAMRSGAISSPRPFSRAAASAAASVTRTSSSARFLSIWPPGGRRSDSHRFEHRIDVGAHTQRLRTRLDGVVGILEAVARKRADYHSARLDASTVGELLEPGDRCGRGRLGKDALARSEQLVRVHDLVVGYRLDHPARLIAGGLGAFPADGVPDPDGRRDGFLLGDRMSEHDRRRAGRLEAHHLRPRRDHGVVEVLAVAHPVGCDVAGIADRKDVVV